MAIIQFPDPRTASPEGIVAIGGDLHPDSVLAAYRQGIFPWPVEKLPLLWFCPAERGVLDFAALHVPRSLWRARRQTSLAFTIDRAFREVIRGCAETPRPGQQGTWITPAVIQAYVRLCDMGIAHSVEAWAGDRLVGGCTGSMSTAPSPPRVCSTVLPTPRSWHSSIWSITCAPAASTGSMCRPSPRTWLGSGRSWSPGTGFSTGSSAPGGSACGCSTRRHHGEVDSTRRHPSVRAWARNGRSAAK